MNVYDPDQVWRAQIDFDEAQRDYNQAWWRQALCVIVMVLAVLIVGAWIATGLRMMTLAGFPSVFAFFGGVARLIYLDEENLMPRHFEKKLRQARRALAEAKGPAGG
jgi:hypothetical protein